MGGHIGHAVEHDFEPGDEKTWREEHASKQKPRIIEDIYRSTRVEGKNVPVVKRTVPHGAIAKPENQYGKSRIIAGGKGRK